MTIKSDGSVRAYLGSRLRACRNRFLAIALLPLFASLTACNAVVMNPSGNVAVQQRDLVIISTVLMLLIIMPVMILTVFFAWRYRQSNTDAPYDPDWDHSTQLELLIWAAPLLIIICLGAVTWMATHLLDPYRALGRSPGEAVSEETKPLQVEVVALDWKWLFIYPEYGVATVNEMAAPVDRPIEFRLTSSSVMNSFYVPALAGQIYTMPGMQTKLSAVINHPGVYQGFSANYSGAGFSGMRFAFRGLPTADFDKWVADVKAQGSALDRNIYLQLEQPSENDPERRYASVDPELFGAVLNRCVEPGKMCMSEMSAIDAQGGLGLAGIYNVRPLEYNKYARRGAVFGPEISFVAAICSTSEALKADVDAQLMSPRDPSPITGANLPRPFSAPLLGFQRRLSNS
ncbi:ubiquinol oxidase subunit II [Phyllobacterium sp. LjRoot231]|uniref:ubiquinol oxidase subunit II n=1 Tax=Phyllobacterium sp. LjRoot231 TaxID=3342289 RepID=UPI003ECF61C0